MRYLITGAGGFIGQALTKRLLEKGETVYLVYRSNRHNAPPNIPTSDTAANAIPIFADLSCTGWTEAIPDAVDVVLHLAQSKHYREFPEGAQDMVNININSTSEILNWSQQNGVQKFLLASTGNVYEPSAKLLDEMASCHPTSMYAATKLSAEYLVEQYANYFSTVILRLFGVYGPNQRDMIVPSMIERVSNGRKITLAQGAGLYFTPIYLSDCIKQLEILLKATREQPASEVYNIAGNEIVTLSDIVGQIAEFYEVKLQTVRVEDSASYLQGSNSKICQMTHYTPQVSFTEGLNQVLTQWSE